MRPFIDDMAAACADADLVICRAGISPWSKFAAAGGQPRCLPYAVDDHQTGNARFLADRGAYLLPQSELTPDRLAGILSVLTAAACCTWPRTRALAEAARGRRGGARRCAELGGGEQA